MIAGTPASLIAIHSVGSWSRPIPQVIITEKTPSPAMKLRFFV